MQYRTADLLFLMAAIAVAFGWWNVFSTNLTLEWYVRHPVAAIETEVNGEKVLEQRRVLMYYALDEFWTPRQFFWVKLKFYALVVLQIAFVFLGSVGIVLVALQRWPRTTRQIAKFLGLVLLVLVTAFVLFAAGMQ